MDAVTVNRTLMVKQKFRPNNCQNCEPHKFRSVHTRTDVGLHLQIKFRHGVPLGQTPTDTGGTRIVSGPGLVTRVWEPGASSRHK